MLNTLTVNKVMGLYSGITYTREIMHYCRTVTYSENSSRGNLTIDHREPYNRNLYIRSAKEKKYSEYLYKIH